MKKLTTLLLFYLLMFAGTYGQQIISPYSEVTIHERMKIPVAKESPRIYRGLLLVDENFPENKFTEAGNKINSRAGNILSVSVPAQNLNKLGEVQGVKLFNIDSRIYTKMDSVRAGTGTNLVHEGYNLPDNYEGSNVIIGVIDEGFDFTHPAFKNTNGDSRIKAVWDHNGDGNPPANYDYGAEYTGEQIAEAEHSTSGVYYSHGTHVAAIAGGGAYLNDGEYTGIAPEADLVLVELGDYGESSLIDAITYIFDKADEEGKPAVINMSLGTQLGPHDGNSMLDLGFEALVGEGKLLVGAAGNEGDMKVHFHKTSGVDSIRTVVNGYLSGENPGFKLASADIWGTVGKPLSIRLSIVDSLTGTVVAASNLYTAGQPTLEFQIIKDGGFLCYLYGAGLASFPLNNKPNIYFGGMVKLGYLAVLTIVSEGEVHVWNEEEAEFTDGGFPDMFTAGNTDYTVGEIGGTGKAVISVGAYTSKNTYVALDGNSYEVPDYQEVGTLADFSSKGPSADGRLKPEITAPGNAIASAISSFDESLKDPFYENLFVKNVEENANTWSYAVFQGTSMAAPVVTGAVALMLQVNPYLTKDAVLNIFSQSSRKDGYTGNIPSTGNNFWGYGKIDVYNAVQHTLFPTGVEDDAKNYDFSIIGNYPNPFNPSTKIAFTIAEPGLVKLEVFNILGEKITTLLNREMLAGLHEVEFSGADLTSGVYFYKLEAGSLSEIRKMIMLK